MLQVIKFVIICVFGKVPAQSLQYIYIVEREWQSHNFLEHFFVYVSLQTTSKISFEKSLDDV